MASPPVDNGQSSGGRKSSAALRPPEHGLNCPRCDSPNTKFCYYNNYSLTQPRHFCKTCRRYWTKGGALRNVPVGGGCRKNKKSKSAAASTSSSPLRLSSDLKEAIGGAPETSAGSRFFNRRSPVVEFQISGGHPFSRLHYSTGACGVYNSSSSGNNNNSNQFISFGDLSSPTTLSSEAAAAGASATPMVGFNYPIQTVGFFNDQMGAGGGGSTSAMNTTSVHGNLASSIESLSSINQDLHWKLQQQRLQAMYFGGENHKQSSTAVAALSTPLLLENQLHQPISFQLPESSKAEDACVGDANATTTEWFLENSYTTANHHHHHNNNGINNNNNTINNTSSWSGIQTWNDMHQFSALP